MCAYVLCQRKLAQMNNELPCKDYYVQQLHHAFDVVFRGCESFSNMRWRFGALCSWQLTLPYIVSAAAAGAF
jgi:hypothetical protein